MQNSMLIATASQQVDKAVPLYWQLQDLCHLFSAELDLIAILVYLPEGCVNLQQGHRLHNTQQLYDAYMSFQSE